MLSSEEIIQFIYEGKICPYCGADSVYVDSSAVYSKSYGMIYMCEPCDAYVGVHKGTNAAKGRLANAELRFYKKEAHAFFDPIWMAELNKGEAKSVVRNKVYDWLSNELKIHRGVTHIGFFDIELCKRTIAICEKIVPEPIRDIPGPQIQEPTKIKIADPPKRKTNMPKPEILVPKEVASIRDLRTVVFLEDWLPKFEEKFGDQFTYDEKKYCYTLIVTNEKSEIDIFDYYPKSNKVLFRKENRWIKPGLRWMIDSFLTD